MIGVPAPPRRPGRWKAVGVSAAFLVSGLLLALVCYAGFVALFWRGKAPDFSGAAAMQSAAMLLAFGLATWALGFRAAGLGPRALRWVPGGKAGLRGAGLGLLLGALPAVLTLAAAVPLAGARWTPDGGGLLGWGSSLGAAAVILAPAALAEEVVFRGVPLVLLARAFGRPAAIVGLAVLFGLAHLPNPEVTGLAVGNVALAGVFLGTAFYLPGGLWTATGAHLGWNLTLAALAAPVSGLPLPVVGLDYWPGGPVWLTGGGFGPEGGLLATGALAMATVVVARRAAREPESDG